MKYLNPKLVKTLSIFFSLVNGALLYWRYSRGEPILNSITDFFIIGLLIGVFYLLYISCVIWIHESIANVSNVVRVLGKDSKDNYDLNLKNFNDLLYQISKMNKDFLEKEEQIENNLNGLIDVLFTISQENEVFRSKLLNIQNSHDGIENLLGGLNSNIKNDLQSLKTDLQQEQLLLNKNIGNLKNELLKEQSALDEKLKSIDLLSKDMKSISNKEFQSLNFKINKGEKELVNVVQNIKNQNYYNYNRVDALFSIHQLIKLRSPLPIMHDWAISSDFAHYLLKTILSKGKGNIIDIGSGISTILMGYAVEKNGSGKVISLEHDKEYYDKTLALIKEHHLENYVEVNYCPLINYEIDNMSWLWYDISEVIISNNITLISVDGPPGNTQKLARYPAIPLLKKHIKKGTTILLDDAKRPEETQIGELWSKENYLSKEFIDGYKGIFKLEK